MEHVKSTNSRRNPRKQTAQEQREQADLLASLEHLITAGCKRKHEAERRQEFRIIQEMLLEQQHAMPWVYMQGEDNKNGMAASQGMQTKDSKKQAPSKKAPKKEVLTEDIRIYGEVGGAGKDGFARRPWPTQRKKSLKSDHSNSDMNWEIEHGDGIHPLAFLSTRLSQSDRTKSNDELKAINGTNLHVSTTDTSLALEHIPRALLVRCWERAVHAASMTIPIRVGPKSEISQHGREQPDNGDVPSSTLFGVSMLGLGEPKTNNLLFIPEHTPIREPPFVIKQRETARDYSATRAKCRSLGINLSKSDLPIGLAKLACPACLRIWESEEALRLHYFGGKNYYGGGSQEKGCCWNKIPQKQTDVIGQVLQLHAKAQVDEFIGLVMERAKERIVEPADGKIGQKRRRLLNWYDILKFAENTFESSNLIRAPIVNARDGKHPMFETLQRKSKGVPLVLNPIVLYTVRERLVDRYANLPL